jgi:hypothetical protein
VRLLLPASRQAPVWMRPGPPWGGVPRLVLEEGC